MEFEHRALFPSKALSSPKESKFLESEYLVILQRGGCVKRNLSIIAPAGNMMAHRCAPQRLITLHKIST